jgi:hypothetical protein
MRAGETRREGCIIVAGVGRIPINISELVGDTPLVGLPEMLEGTAAADNGVELFAKLESFNPGGSVKDRIGVAMIEAAEAEGRIEPGRTTIVEATSGNTGIALAFVCAAKGYDLVLTLPQGMSRERESLLRLYGARVDVTESLGGMTEAVEAARAMARSEDVFLPDQFSNPANPEAHRRRTGPEIERALDGRVDALVRASARVARSRASANTCASATRSCASWPSSRETRPSSPEVSLGRTASRGSARASSRLSSIASCSTRSWRCQTRMRSTQPGDARAALACSPGSPAVPRCGHRCNSPHVPSRPGSESW